MIILFGIAFLIALFGIRPSSGTQMSGTATEDPPVKKEEDQIEKDSREDSEGDGLMEFDGPMFSPEFDDEDDDL